GKRRLSAPACSPPAGAPAGSPASEARAPQTLADAFVVRSQLLPPLERGPCLALLAELQGTPPPPPRQRGRAGRGQAGPDEHRQRLAIPLAVVEAPRDLGPQDGHLGRFGTGQTAIPVERPLERRQRVVVSASLEQHRAEPVRGVDVLGITL